MGSWETVRERCIVSDQRVIYQLIHKKKKKEKYIFFLSQVGAIVKCYCINHISFFFLQIESYFFCYLKDLLQVTLLLIMWDSECMTFAYDSLFYWNFY